MPVYFFRAQHYIGRSLDPNDQMWDTHSLRIFHFRVLFLDCTQSRFQRIVQKELNMAFFLLLLILCVVYILFSVLFCFVSSIQYLFFPLLIHCNYVFFFLPSLINILYSVFLHLSCVLFTSSIAYLHSFPLYHLCCHFFFLFHRFRVFYVSVMDFDVAYFLSSITNLYSLFSFHSFRCSNHFLLHGIPLFFLLII